MLRVTSGPRSRSSLKVLSTSLKETLCEAVLNICTTWILKAPWSPALAYGPHHSSKNLSTTSSVGRSSVKIVGFQWRRRRIPAFLMHRETASRQNIQRSLILAYHHCLYRDRRSVRHVHGSRKVVSALYVTQKSCRKLGEHDHSDHSEENWSGSVFEK